MNDSFSPNPGARRAARQNVEGPAARTLASLALLLVLASVAGPALAEQADRDKPADVQADHMSYDDLKQLTILTGHVVLTKGTIIIRAENVTVRLDPEGYQYATAIATGNDLAYFRQKRDIGNEYIEGNAQRIDYDSKRDVTTLTGRAVVRRLLGTSKIIDQIHGAVITYNGQTDFYTASAQPGKSGSSSSAGGSGDSGGRVRAMLSPRNDGAAPLQDAPVQLKPSSQLPGGDSQ